MTEDDDIQRWSALLTHRRDAALPDGFAEAAIAHLRTLAPARRVGARRVGLALSAGVALSAAAAVIVAEVTRAPLSAADDGGETVVLVELKEEDNDMHLTRSTAAAVAAAVAFTPSPTAAAPTAQGASHGDSAPFALETRTRTSGDDGLAAFLSRDKTRGGDGLPSFSSLPTGLFILYR